jgi:hypothetical protein
MRALTALAGTVLLSAAPAFGQCSGFLPVQQFLSPDDAVLALGTYDPDGAGPQPSWLVVTGTFANSPVPESRGIVAWDGNTWRGLGTGVNGSVYALATYNGELVAAGFFTQAGATSVSNIARWSPSAGWRALGAVEFEGPIFALASFRGELVAGGDFICRSLPANPPAANVVNWNGSSWRRVESNTGAGLTPVYAMAEWFETLYLGGHRIDFMSVQGTVYPGDPFPAGRVYAMAVHDGDLYIAGTVVISTQVGAAQSIARFIYNVGLRPLPGNGTSGNPASINGPIYALASLGDQLMVGGGFTQIGTLSAPRLATWSPLQGWSAVGQGTSGPVLALREFGPQLFLGGTFTYAGSPGSTGTNFARYTQLALPVITSQPVSRNAARGGSFSLSVSAVATEGTLSYAWHHNGVPISDGPGGISILGGIVSGAATPTLTVSALNASDRGVFTCIVSNGCASVASQPAVVEVTPRCDPDFNGDGNVDQDDVTSLIGVIAGQDCP